MISPVSEGGPNIALITIICGWTFMGIALLAVSLFVWSRRKANIGFGLDGYLTILALVTSIALIAQTTWAIVDEGQDSHEAKISKTKFALVVRSLLVNETLWGVEITLVRISALLSILRVFGPSKMARRIALSLLVLSILYGLVVLLEVFLICRPMAVDWDAHVDGTCGDQIVSYLVLEVLGLLLDFIILMVPPLCIWKLQMPFGIKMPFIIVFSIGVLVFIITGLRIQALHMVNAQDFTYSKGYLGLLSTLGASLEIIFCCAPAVHKVYQQWRQASQKRLSSLAVQTPIEISFPMREESIDLPNLRFSAWLKSGSSGVPSTQRQPLRPHVGSAPLTEDSATQYCGRGTRWSMDGCVAGVKAPPCGGLRRHRTF